MNSFNTKVQEYINKIDSAVQEALWSNKDEVVVEFPPNVLGRKTIATLKAHYSAEGWNFIRKQNVIREVGTGDRFDPIHQGPVKTLFIMRWNDDTDENTESM